MRFAAFLLMASLTAPAGAQVMVKDAWTRATPPSAKIAVGYMTIHNSSASADRLMAARSLAVKRIETHITIRDGNISRMRQVKGYQIPAEGTLELKPGGAHLMLVDISHPFKEGESIPIVLSFEHAGEVKAKLKVRPLAANGEMHMGH